MYGFVIRMFPRMTPLTSNTTIRGPSAAHAAARLPAPEALRLVTLITFPPRPPALPAPHPSAPGKAFTSFPALASPTLGRPVVTAKRQPQTAHANRVLIVNPSLPGRGGHPSPSAMPPSSGGADAPGRNPDHTAPPPAPQVHSARHARPPASPARGRSGCGGWP